MPLNSKPPALTGGEETSALSINVTSNVAYSDPGASPELTKSEPYRPKVQPEPEPEDPGGPPLFDDAEVEASTRAAMRDDCAPANDTEASGVHEASDPNWGNLTDLGNAERMVQRHGADLHYSFDLRKWLVWQGTHWNRDNMGLIGQHAKETVRSLYAVAQECPDEKQAAKFATWAMRSEDSSHINSLVSLARSEKGIPIEPKALDTNRMLLNLLNGTLDLKTGELRDHRKEDLISHVIPIKYDEKAMCPRWLEFLREVTQDNTNLIEFLWRAFGYSLTGEIIEQVLFFLLGVGKNGKTVLAGVLQKLLGDYGCPGAPDLLIVKHGDTHPTEQADLFGRRVVVCSETESGKRFAEAAVKRLTGSDELKVRRMREDFWKFDPTHKFWVIANFKPVILGNDDAIWRRIMLVPFDYIVPPEKRDERLPEKLEAELPGILNWAVQGCLDWQKGGLRPPTEVLDANAQYRAESDVIHSFVAEMCEVQAPGSMPEYRVLTSKLFGAYQEYSGDRTATMALWVPRIVKLGYLRLRSNGKSVFKGIRLADQDNESLYGG